MNGRSCRPFRYGDPGVYAPARSTPAFQSRNDAGTMPGRCRNDALAWEESRRRYAKTLAHCMIDGQWPTPTPVRYGALAAHSMQSIMVAQQ